MSFVFPGEFEQHESIWMALGPTNKENNYEFSFKVCTEEPTRYSPFQQVQLPMMESLLVNNNVNGFDFYIDLIIHEEEDKINVEKFLKQRNNISHELIEKKMRYHVIEHLDVWMRDNGPIFVIDKENKKKKIIDFGFTLWTYCKPHDKEAIIEEAVDRKVAHELNIPVVRSHLISEGGNREYNGNGVLMMVEDVEMKRNKDNNIENREQIECEMRRVFGKSAAKIIWLETEGLVEDQSSYRGLIPGTDLLASFGTNGHIDEWARFSSENTILIAYVPDHLKDPISVENRKRLEQNYELLKKSTNLNGEPFEIIKVPVGPHVIMEIKKGDSCFENLQELEFEDGFVMHDDQTYKFIIASSYLNFLVSNNTVLISEYYREGLSQHVKDSDEEALQIFKKIYPNHVIVPIATESINMGGGGMHCITQQMPSLL